MQNRINNKDTKNLINNRATNKARYANIKVAPLQKSALQIVMWLLAFITLFVLALQPVLQNRGTLTQAGRPSDDTWYNNAPPTIIGYDAKNDVDGLFTTTGINASVLLDLLNVINDKTVWNGGDEDPSNDKEVPTNDTDVEYLTAKDFGNYGDQSTWGEVGANSKKGNAQIVVKLFETVSGANNVESATEQYWQAVYRSVSKDEDVLTLYMVDDYIDTEMFDSEYADYTKSDIRDVITNTYSTLSTAFATAKLDDYLVAPANLPGKWQSSAYQTSYKSNGAEWTSSNGVSHDGGTKTGSGVSGYGQNSPLFNVGNGMDGLGDRWSSWGTQDRDTYYDKLWLPSAFEVLHTGYDSDDSGSVATIQDTGRYFDKNEAVTYMSSTSPTASTGLNSSSWTKGEDGRTGLWELNGYDRATGSSPWLRSGFSFNAVSAREVHSDGNGYNGGVLDSIGVRVALHLNLKSLANALFASVSADASAGNVSFPDRGWEPTIESKYSNLIIKNSSESSISATYSFDTFYKMTSFTLNGTPVTVSADSGSGSVSGVCDYSYQVGSGNVVITISNASQNVNIEAQLDNVGYALTFDHRTNGGTSTTATNGIYVQGATVDLSTITAKKDGWEFEGWSTDKDAHSGSKTTFQMPGQATTLYAIFSKTLTASFYQINTSSAETRDVTIYNTATSGDITNIPAVNSSLSIAGATNIQPVGWIKQGSSSPEGSTITLTKDEVFYARVNYTITITYNGNGGGVSQASSTGTVTMTANGQATGATPTSTQITLANNTTPRPNYTFVGWNSNSGGTGTSYTAGQSYSFSASTTLYAVWDKTTTTAQLTITLATPSEAGVIIYLVQGNEVAKQFVVMGETKTISVELTKGEEYKIIVSKPYTWQVEYTGNGSVQKDNYVFTASSADVSETQYTITVSGGSIPNNWWIV